LKHSRAALAYNIFFLTGRQMFDVNKHLIGILIGGTFISTIGAATTYYVEKTKPSAKTIMRDFIIGAVLMMLVFQLLPESSSSMVSGLTSLIPMTGGFLAAAGGGSNDVEVKVGIPNF
jgi:hypothetical protein